MKVTVDNTDIFVGQGGVSWRPGLKTLLWQHGAGMDRTVWVLLARYFARHGYNVVVADLPGHGASGGEPLTTIESQASFIWSLIDTLRASHGLPEEPVVLGGHSMGALAVAEAAARRPEAVEHVLLMGAGYPMPVGQTLLDAAEANEQAAVDMIAIYSHCYASQLGHNPVAGISVQNAAMALLERSAPGVLFADLTACNHYQGLDSDAYPLLEGRVSVIVGDSDRMTPGKMSRQLAGLLKAQLMVLNNCGHMLMSEQPEQTLQAVKQILAH